jgi:hypothetical protein
MLHTARYLTAGNLHAEPHSAAPPNPLTDVTASVGGNQGSNRANHTATVQLASCAGLVTRIRSTAAGNGAAQR